MARVWGYARGSVLPDFATVDEQRQLISDYVASQLAGHEFMGVTVDDKLAAREAKFLDRPGATQLNNQMQRGDHLVVASMDRGWRTMGDFLSCVEAWLERGIFLHVLDFGLHVPSPLHREISVLQAVARWAKLVHTERYKEAWAMNGYTTAPYCPRVKLGFKTVAVPGGRTKHRHQLMKMVPDEKERKLLREIVERVDGGSTWSEIARDFKNRGERKRLKNGKTRLWSQYAVGYAYRVAKAMIAKGEL